MVANNILSIIKSFDSCIAYNERNHFLGIQIHLPSRSGNNFTIHFQTQQNLMIFSTPYHLPISQWESLINTRDSKQIWQS